MKQLTFVIAAALLALPGGQVFGLEDPVPWWDEPLPDDATGFNCFGTVRYENGQFVQTPAFKFPEQALAPSTHPDAVCVQTGPVDGWYRQQFKWLHVKRGFVDPTTHEQLFCAPVGEPCDAHGTRLCTPKSAGQVSPCGTITGPNGCAPCGKVLPSKER
ncbi:MAG TPA: hypothetical protein VEO36_08050 [Casimicrobiaceae bacterium]|nr:hypothetical protein [Casimicrobiaceae bacterium]